MIIILFQGDVLEQSVAVTKAVTIEVGNLMRFLAFALLMLLPFHAYAGEPPELKTEKDRVNYAIGVNLIGNLRQQGVDIDLDRVIQGMRDSHSGGKLLLSDEEIRIGIDKYQTAVRQRQSAIRSKTAEDNKKEGEAFLSENANKEGVTVLASGLQYKVLKAGEGKIPTDEDTVEVKYRGTFINGVEFEGSPRTGSPAAFKVSEVIPGWREALKLMPAGSKWQLVVPPKLAYGERGTGRIGPQATLIFELELLGIR